jgi:hypothetical protein
MKIFRKPFEHCHETSRPKTWQAVDDDASNVLLSQEMGILMLGWY